MALPERFEGQIGWQEEGKVSAKDGWSVISMIGIEKLTRGDERKKP